MASIRIKQWGIVWVALFIMLNALVDIGASLYLGEWVPGVMSSPIFFMAALMLIVTTGRAGKSANTE